MRLEIDNQSGEPQHNLDMLQSLFTFLIRRLGVEHSSVTVKLTIRENTLFDMLQNVNGETDGKGIIDNTLGVWIASDSGQNPIEIFAHEMVHVADIIDGKLKLDNKVPYWNGVRYDNGFDIPHDRRPWEERAIEVSAQLLKEYADEYNKLAA